MNNNLLTLKTRRGAQGVPKGTNLTLRGQRLESNAPMSQTGPEPAHPITIVLTIKARDQLLNHSHTGTWLLYGQYRDIILVRPDLPQNRDGSRPDDRTAPHAPGVLMKRPLWTTFVKEEVIDYYDGPRAFLKRDRNGQDYLVLWTDADHWTTQWLHLPLNPDNLRQVLTGAITIRQAIKEADFIFFVDEDPDGTPIQTVMTLPASIPAGHPMEEAMPQPGVTLSYPPQVADKWLADDPPQ